MRLHYVQHVSYEPPTAIAEWARERGHEVTGTHRHESEPLPDIDDFDWLVVMGGPMGVHDAADYPWLDEEKRFIRRAVEAGAVVVGVCLGAQLTAAALDARVTECADREIGWFPVSATDEATESAVSEALPSSFSAFHWHGDTFDVPDGATRVYESQGCPNQAFVYDDRVVGLQFHLEVTPESVAALVKAAGDQGDGRYVQDVSTLTDHPGDFENLRAHLYSLLDALADRHS